MMYLFLGIINTFYKLHSCQIENKGKFEKYKNLAYKFINFL